MKAVVLGDVHGRFEAIWTAYEREKPDVMFHVGDLARQEYGEKRLDVGEYPSELPPVPFVWILGNHENLKTYMNVGTPLGFFGTYGLKGLKVVGVGGVPGGKREVHWGKNKAIEKLKTVRHAPILLTHETCSPFIHARNGKDLGSADLAAECARMRPKYHFSGHHHYASIEKIGGTVHCRLPYASDGYAVYADGKVDLVRTNRGGLGERNLGT